MRDTLSAFAALALTACIQPLGEPDETSSPKDSDADADTDTDVDTDADGDADGDADVDCGALDLAMVRIEGGTFWMGSPAEEEGRDDDELLHQVTLTRAYCFGITEVTQGEWEEAMGSPSAYFEDCGTTCPAETMTWHEAAAYTNALSARESLEECYDCIGDGGSVTCTRAGDPYACAGYRLPTEAEWEKAARGGASSAFPDGGELPAGVEESCDPDLRLTSTRRISDFAWWCGNETDSTHPGRVLASSPAGLFDLSGNVYEWCHDGYAAYPEEATDPVGSDAAERKVQRGGSFASYAPNLRAAARHAADSTSTGYTAGLRVARSATP